MLFLIAEMFVINCYFYVLLGAIKVSENTLIKAISITLKLLISLNGRVVPFLGIDSNGAVQQREKCLMH